MGVYSLALLFVFVIPIAKGVLLTLLLREVYTRHPLPLGGTIGPRKPRRPTSIESVETTDESSTEETAETENNTEEPNESTFPIPESIAAELSVNEPAPKEPITTDNAAAPAGVDVFKEAEKVPEALNISSVLEAMTAETSATLPNDLENRIEASSQHIDKFYSEILDDDDDAGGQQIPAKQQPSTPIDFARELEEDPEHTGTVSSLAKEMFGENYDFDALEQTAGDQRQTAALDIREEAGTVQVISSYTFDTAPQYADFAMPQTVLPTFSADWIQEPNSTNGWSEGDAAKFCFTEELRPMFSRKKKNG